MLYCHRALHRVNAVVKDNQCSDTTIKIHSPTIFDTKSEAIKQLAKINEFVHKYMK